LRGEARCPAKINLWLTVGPPDSRGMHPLRTEFQAVSVSDTLMLEPAPKDEIVCDWPGLPSENTVTKALRLAREYFEVPPIRIRLEKRIPAQSGLGGGSSDAGGLLRLLVRQSRLSPREATEIATAVGADVPFFLVGGRALGEGYGERLSPMPDLPVRRVVLAMPGEAVSTGGAFARLDQVPRQWTPGSDAQIGQNDFEAVAPEPCRAILAAWRAIGSVCGLTGSGSACFALGEETRLVETARRAGAAWVEVGHTLSREESLWTS
jgi:4-diphosphocytidyl-2-C-methyl-D-erythritol kinase